MPSLSCSPWPMFIRKIVNISAAKAAAQLLSSLKES